MNSEERAIVAIETFGYIVLAAEHEMPIGLTTTTLCSHRGPLPQPFMIVGNATQREAQRQEDLFAKLEGRTPEIINDTFYYKLTTD